MAVCRIIATKYIVDSVLNQCVMRMDGFELWFLHGFGVQIHVGFEFVAGAVFGFLGANLVSVGIKVKIVPHKKKHLPYCNNC